ncbi:MAG TPA: signal peptide peptidase SppA [Acidobacteriota bacterium]|nr:signal peptide peptidase SppA [Acidobacteriota bacterium]
MAKKRDVIAAVLIAIALVVAVVFFAVILIGVLVPGEGIDFAGLGGTVGVVEIMGVIREDSGRPIVKQLDKWADNQSIKAVVLHINSGGGEVAISQEMYDAVTRLKAEKPVVVAMAAVAASGAFYIACAADRVVANPGSLTGSIGVILQFHTFETLMSKVGIGTETVKSGELKDVGTYSREMTEKERLMLHSVIMDSYEQFVEVVAEGRGKEKDEVYRLADGSVFTGLQAYNLGLVDTLGGLHEAVEIAADLAGLEGKPKVVRPYKRDKIGIFDLLPGLLGEFGQTVDKAVSGPRLLYLYQ